MPNQDPPARYGAAAQAGFAGSLPTAFPRAIGPSAGRLLGEVMGAGLASDMVTRFERAFAEAMGVRHCVATPGCTPALAVWAAAAGYQPGDEIVVSSISDYGTIMGLVKEGLIPVFADTLPDGPNVGVETIEPLLTDRTRAVLVVHKTGLMVDLDPLAALCRERGLTLVEDACQAVYSRGRGRLAGTIGEVGAFSFDPEKTMGADTGGCLLTDDDDFAARARFVGHSRGGVERPGFGRVHVEAGYAYRMTQCTAAVCLAQLDIAPDQVAHRDRMIRLLYDRLAAIEGIEPPAIPAWQEVHSCWMAGFALTPGAFTCTTDEFAAACAAGGIPGAGTGRYYLLPASCQFLAEAAAAERYPYSRPPASRRYCYGAECCPNAAAYLERFVRWSTFCEKYQPEHCELAAEIVGQVAARFRR